MDLVTCSGVGKNGSLYILSRTIRPLPKFSFEKQFHDCRGLWSLAADTAVSSPVAASTDHVATPPKAGQSAGAVTDDQAASTPQLVSANDGCATGGIITSYIALSMPGGVELHKMEADVVSRVRDDEFFLDHRFSITSIKDSLPLPMTNPPPPLPTHSATPRYSWGSLEPTVGLCTLCK